MQFTVTAGEGLPVGSYAAQFVSAEAISNEYGDAVKLLFKVLQGDHQGQHGTRICSIKLSPKSNLFRFIQAFKGAKPEAGETIDLTTYYGMSGMILVSETESGGTRVESFLKMA